MEKQQTRTVTPSKPTKMPRATRPKTEEKEYYVCIYNTGSCINPVFGTTVFDFVPDPEEDAPV